MRNKKAWDLLPPTASPTTPQTHIASTNITIIPVLWYLRQTSSGLSPLKQALQGSGAMADEYHHDVPPVARQDPHPPFDPLACPMRTDD